MVDSGNMLHIKTSKLASGTHSEKCSGRVSIENGHFASTSKYKHAKVYAIRDFPPGCGWLDVPIDRPSEQVVYESENPALLFDWVDKVECERVFR